MTSLIANAVTKLDNKAIQGGLTVADRHRPFLRGRLDRQKHHIQRQFIARKELALLHGLADHYVASSIFCV